MPEDKSQPPQEQPWENGWAPDTSRAPGTRRLWLAGGMALATIIACITAIAVTERASDGKSGQTRTVADDATVPGLISFATPSQTTPPKGKSGLSTERPTKTPGRPDAAPPKPTPEPEPSKPPAGEAGSPTATPKPPAADTWRSIRSVNYPDRYWHVSDGYVALDRVGGSESRQDSTFKQVKGLANGSCLSFATDDGRYLRHRNFVLRAERNDGSAVFAQDATFCPRGSYHSGAAMLESVNYPGYFLRHKNFVVRLERYEHSSLYQADSAFRLVDGLA
ncbi:AbfB domain-containing protein [Streptomyces sp. UG1]|uniref:AbfB domain-containing protein n=1 Tax=Streptomyces sp. UG1 TaxID=3417652 RepID=UPI003CEA1C74